MGVPLLSLFIHSGHSWLATFVDIIKDGPNYNLLYLFCEYRLGAPYFDTCLGILKIPCAMTSLTMNFNVHCYILWTHSPCKVVTHYAWCSQIIHGGLSLECKLNHYVFLLMSSAMLQYFFCLVIYMCVVVLECSIFLNI